MPRTRKKAVKRYSVSLPISTIKEIDRIIEKFPEFNWNRLSFVQEVVHEKLLSLRQLALKESTATEHTQQQNRQNSRNITTAT